jgi:hypothetical protein
MMLLILPKWRTGLSYEEKIEGAGLVSCIYTSKGVWDLWGHSDLTGQHGTSLGGLGPFTLLAGLVTWTRMYL